VRREGLLVDYGGVLTTDMFASFSAFCELEGLDPETITRRFREDRDCRQLLIAFETGEVEEIEFERRFAAMLGVQEAELLDRLLAGSGPDPAMVAAVRAARAGGVRTGMVSNSWGTSRYDRALLGELFDAVVISGEVGVRKPSPEIYLLGAAHIGLEPAACVFVDDLSFNLPPAAELGMATVHHRRAEETIAELERLLGVSMR
jgi:epoxide hydrolase-like predicted phosphatase